MIYFRKTSNASLVVTFWLFVPKFWEVVGTYKLLVCSQKASVVLTMLGDRDTQTLLDGKEMLNLIHLQVVVMQKLSNFP